MSLFKNGQFQASSGVSLPFKIDCDSLTDEDLETLAIQCRKMFPAYKYYSVSRGGDRFFEHLNKMVYSFGKDIERVHQYIVDDVWTTGKSVVDFAIQRGLFHDLGKGTRCLVIFARGPYPGWVTPLFKLNSQLMTETNVWDSGGFE